jgi:hypothetical protein
MDLKKSFGTSDALENDGAWVDLGDGASIKVARVGNKANRALLKKLIAPHKIAVRSAKKLTDYLTWQLEWGDKQGMFDAMPESFMPQALLNEPQLWAENQELLEAFYRLHSTRQNGMNGAQAIVMAEIVAYCQLFDVDDKPYFFNAISNCDQVFFKNQAANKKTD